MTAPRRLGALATLLLVVCSLSPRATSEAPAKISASTTPVLRSEEPEPRGEEGPNDAPSSGVSPQDRVSTRRPLADLGNGVFLVDATTGEATRLPRTIPQDLEPGWCCEGWYQASPDGTELMWWDSSADPDGTTQVYLGNIDGTDVRQVTNDPSGAGAASWAPDGTKIVYVGGIDGFDNHVGLFVLDLRTGETVQVLDDVGANDVQVPHFSRDGASVLFTRWRVSPRGPDLWSVPVSGGKAAILLDDLGYGELSPDGAMIAYPRFVNIPLDGGRGGLGGQEIWLARADGAHAHPIAWGGQNPWSGSGFGTWSPDSTRVAYNFGSVFVTDVTTGKTMMIARSKVAFYDWLDDDTLIIEGWTGRTP